MLFEKFLSVLLLGTIVFSPGCGEEAAPVVNPLEMPVVKVLQQDVPLISEFSGQTLGGSDIQITPRVKGLIESIDFLEGAFVTKGQLLYTIEPNTYQNNVDVARADVAESETMLAAAKSDYERIDALVKINAVSQRELEGAKARYDAGIEKVKANQAKLQNAEIDLGYCRVTSPIDGIIGISKVQVGDYVTPGLSISINTVSDTKSIRVRFTLSEQEFLRIYRESQKENSSLTGGKSIQLILSDGSPYDQVGTYSFADRQVDPTTGAITLEARFANPDGLLRPGQFVKVSVAAETRKQVLVIPQRSVIEMQGTFQVFTLGDSNKVSLVIIEPGPSFQDAYIVESGLSASDQVIMGGTQLLKSGNVIVPQPTEWAPGDNLKKAAGTK